MGVRGVCGGGYVWFYGFLGGGGYDVGIVGGYVRLMVGYWMVVGLVWGGGGRFLGIVV